MPKIIFLGDSLLKRGTKHLEVPEDIIAWVCTSGARASDAKVMLEKKLYELGLNVDKVDIIFGLGYNDWSNYKSIIAQLQSIDEHPNVNRVLAIVPPRSHENFIRFKKDPGNVFYVKQLEEYKELEKYIKNSNKRYNINDDIFVRFINTRRIKNFSSDFYHFDKEKVNEIIKHIENLYLKGKLF